MRVVASLLLLSKVSGITAENIIIAGDSWADYLGIPNREFPAVFEQHGDRRTIRNIAVAGTTCAQWATGNRLSSLVSAVRANDAQHVWLSCGGNDAQFNMPGCKPQDECITKIVADVRKDLGTILQAVNEANARVRVVGFGYDIMGFGSIVGQLLIRNILPECAGDAFCSNTEWFRMQEAFDVTAREHSNFDSVNLLGSLQAAAGVAGAAVGQPVIGQWTPNSQFDLTSFHPTAAGYRTLFENFYSAYWAKYATGNTSKLIPFNVTGK